MQKVPTLFSIAFSNKAEAQTESNMEIEKHTTNEDFHLGKLIKTELMRQGRSITWLATQINCSRENLYQLFRNQWIHAETLYKIGKALNYDFFRHCSEYQDIQKEKKN